MSVDNRPIYGRPGDSYVIDYDTGEAFFAGLWTPISDIPKLRDNYSQFTPEFYKRTYSRPDLGGSVDASAVEAAAWSAKNFPTPATNASGQGLLAALSTGVDIKTLDVPGTQSSLDILRLPHPDASNLTLGPNLGGEDAVQDRPGSGGTGPPTTSNGFGPILLLGGAAILLFTLFKGR